MRQYQKGLFCKARDDTGSHFFRCQNAIYALGTAIFFLQADGLIHQMRYRLAVALKQRAVIDPVFRGRLAKRAIAGLARTGASMTNGSGDYVVAFSTAENTGSPSGTPTTRCTPPPEWM